MWYYVENAVSHHNQQSMATNTNRWGCLTDAQGWFVKCSWQLKFPSNLCLVCLVFVLSLGWHKDSLLI